MSDGKPIQRQYDKEKAISEFNKLTVESLVIKHCLAKGVISQEDINLSSRRYLWLHQVITMKLLAIELEIVDDIEVTLANLDKCYKTKHNKSTKIIQTISQKILMSLPTYTH